MLRRLLRRKGRSWPRYILRLVVLAIGAFIVLSVGLTALLRFVNPPVTPLMVKMAFEKHKDGSRYGITREWRDLDEISPNLVLAVVAAEDNRFLKHHGFDFEAIQKAQEHNKKSKRKRGASTISMQTAKNVFLWPTRNYLRKGFEVWFTVLIEVLWGKERIMEVYLNVIETGKGLYGAEAAAQKYYHRPAAKLTRQQAAMIASILPNPRQRNPANPTSYLNRRQQKILRNMRNIQEVRFH
ncbi:MAG TPA: monofunctional biosynthetic peptidoglycan transglycosylase [Bacteroidales bacterium]|nr:monofunctional biosynthetic peptidoglycan transglycosylase [Bacteroidales bacterium]